MNKKAKVRIDHLTLSRIITPNGDCAILTLAVTDADRRCRQWQPSARAAVFVSQRFCSV